MSLDELKDAVMALDTEQKKTFILEAFPGLAKEAMQDPSFLMQLLPLMLGILKESGTDLQQLLQLAAMFGGNSQQS